MITGKNYFRAALITGFFAALIIYLPNSRIINTINPDAVRRIVHASIQTDILGHSTIADLKEIQGIKIEYNDYNKYTYYFKYEANVFDTLKVIGALPFSIDNNSSSLACMPMNARSNPLNVVALTQQEREATAFFWNADAEDFTFYECIKSPLKHTLLISKSSSTILHRIETI